MGLCNTEDEFTSSASFTSIPSWTCGKCRNGILSKVMKPTKYETKWSRNGREHNDWEPDWVQEQFAIFYECGKCGRGCVASGHASPAPEYDPEIGEIWTTFYEFKAFTTPPAIVRVEAELPDNVEARLQDAFAHFWTDPDACGNAMRRCVEAVLDDKKVKKQTINTNGKRVGIKTHQRIEHHLKPKMLDAKDYLIALKWSGNAGSHASIDSHSRVELLTMFELLEAALLSVYAEDKHRRLSKSANEITIRKGKPLPKRRWSARRRK